MEDVELERGNSRRKRKLSARQGVVIGVAAVAGLGLMTKLVSFLRRERPKKINDSDVEALEAVLSGDAAKSALPPTKEVHMFANLENDEPDYEVVNGHEASPPSSKDADPLPEVAKIDDVITRDGEVNLTQDLVADTNDLTAKESEPSPVIAEESIVTTVKETPHSNGIKAEVNERNEDTPHIKDEGKQETQGATEVHDEGKVNVDDIVADLDDIEDEVALHVEDVEQIPREDVVERQSENEVKPEVEDAVELHTETEVETKHLNGDALEALVEDATKVNKEDEGKHVSEDAVELPIKDEEKHHDEDAVELQTENEAKPLSDDAIDQLVEDAGKVDSDDKGSTPSIEDAAPAKVLEQHQVEDDGNLHSEEVESIQS